MKVEAAPSPITALSKKSSSRLSAIRIDVAEMSLDICVPLRRTRPISGCRHSCRIFAFRHLSAPMPASAPADLRGAWAAEYQIRRGLMRGQHEYGVAPGVAGARPGSPAAGARLAGPRPRRSAGPTLVGMLKNGEPRVSRRAVVVSRRRAAYARCRYARRPTGRPAFPIMHLWHQEGLVEEYPWLATSV